MRRWRRRGLAAIAALGIGAVLWSVSGGAVREHPTRLVAPQAPALPQLAVPDGISLQAPDPLLHALSVSFLDALPLPPGAARGGRALPRSIDLARDTGEVRLALRRKRSLPEPAHLAWAALAILAGARLRGRRAAG